MSTNLGRTECAILQNKSGGSLSFGDVVVVDSANAKAVTTTTVLGYASGRIGVVMELSGIASNAYGVFAFSGDVPRINLSSSAGIGDLIRTNTVAKEGIPHAAPELRGDFAQALETGTSPRALLMGHQVTVNGAGEYFSPTGLTGATQTTRWVGSTASGAPSTGTFIAGDWVIDSSGVVWTCTVSGSPGTWSASAPAIGGFQPRLFPLGFSAAAAYTTALSLAAAGGTLTIPVTVTAPMLLQSVSIRNTDTTLARTWGWGLYKQLLSTDNSLSLVAACSADESYTASSASVRTLNAGSAPVVLGVGVYWLAIQNRHATNTFGLGSTASTTAFAQNLGQTKTTTNPNGSTLDFTAATWTKITAMVAASLNGRVFGESAAF